MTVTRPAARLGASLPPVGRPEPPHPPARRATAAGTPGQIVNPFLQQDPAARARRLARALISDLVSYQPAKRAEGLRDGTLKELFAEEIRKSYESYVEQVGKEIATSTTHFQDAVNGILAGGQTIL